MNTDATAGRREANKARTRDAVVEAACGLLQSRPLTEVTAEQVAEAAGISRRTFFNYFPSVEAVLAYKAQQVLDALREALAARPVDEPLVDGARAVVDAIFDAATLTEVARTWRLIDTSPAANRYALQASDEAIVDLTEQWAARRLRARSPGVSALQIGVLTAACMAAFDVARRDWLARHLIDIDGPVVDEPARADFVRTVGTAFDLLRPAVDALSDASGTPVAPTA